MRRMMALGVVLASFSFPLADAHAASILIDFDFTAESSVSLLGGTIVTPPDGTLDVGSARLSVEGTDTTTFTPGGEVLLELVSFSGTLSKSIPGIADLSGPYSGTQVGSLAGTLAPGETGALFAAGLILDISALFDCIGSGCAALGFPVNAVGLHPLSIASLAIEDLGVEGSARIDTSTLISLDGVQGVLHLVGVETARSLVPEPGSGVLLVLGAAAFVTWQRRGARQPL